jgi:hypothetical protein
LTVDASYEREARLAWTAIEDGATYKVCRRPVGPDDFSLLAAIPTLEYVDRDVEPGDYEYVISAVHPSFPGARDSNVVKVTIFDFPPPEPLLALRFSINLWEATWALPRDPGDLAGFVLETSHHRDGPFTAESDLLSPDTRVYLGRMPKNDTWVRVVARDRAGHTSASAPPLKMSPGDFKESHDGNFPTTPSGLTATPGETVVLLGWNPQPAQQFRVWRSLVSGSGYVQIATVPGAVYQYQDSGLTAQTYFYRVTAIDCSPPAESPFSNEASATPTDNPPPAPQNLALAYRTQVYDLTWQIPNPPPDLLGSKVYRSWTAGGPYTLMTPTPITGYTYTGLFPKATLYLKVASVDNTAHETMSQQEVAVAPGDVVKQEPKLNPVYLGAAQSVTSNGGELTWGVD